jgi:hypothetical protein
MAMRNAALLLAVALIACDRQREAPGNDISTRVENGVTLVENAGLHLADSTAWKLDTVPSVKVGMLEGPEEYVIGRLAGTLLLPGDSILIADATAHELRLFDPSGKFVRKIGRQGEGPGEFNWLTSVHAYAADSIIVMDHESSRANVLGPDFGYARRFRPSLKETRAKPPFTSHSLVDYFHGGRPLMSDYLSVCDESRSNGLCEDSVAFFATDEAGDTQARFGQFVYSRNQTFRVDAGLSTGWAEPHPQAIWAVRGDRFYYGDAVRFEILVFKATGELERRVRVNHVTPRYERSDVWPPRVRTLPSPRDPRAARARAVALDAQATAAMPDTFPAFSDMLVDADANIWVREYLPQRLARTHRPRWFVFDPEGRLRWSLRSAPGMQRTFRPSTRMSPQIGNDRVLASERDADGVESVVIYRLNKSLH